MGEWAEYEIEREESGEKYREEYEEKKAKRKSNLEWSTNYLKKMGVKFESRNNGIHLIIGEFDFWPSTGKFISRKTKKKSRGVKNLVNILKQKGFIE